MARFQIDVGVDIEDAGVRAFQNRVEASMRQIAEQARSQGNVRNVGQGLERVLGQAEGLIGRSEASGQLSTQAAEAARQAVRKMVEQTRQAISSELSRSVRAPDAGRVAAQAQQIAQTTALPTTTAAQRAQRSATAAAVNHETPIPPTETTEGLLRRRVLQEEEIRALRDLMSAEELLSDMLSRVARGAPLEREFAGLVRATREASLRTQQRAAEAGGMEGPTNLAFLTGGANADQRLRATTEARYTQSILAADEEYLGERVALTQQLRRMRLAQERLLAQTEGAGVERQLGALAADRSLARREGRLGLEPDDGATQLDRQAGVAKAQRVRSDQVAAKSLEDVAAQDVRLAAQRRIEERRYIAARNEAAARIVRDELSPAERGTRFQQIQQVLARRQGGEFKLPTEFQTAGQFLGSRALTTAGFAASGALLFGVANGIRQISREVLDLERVMIRVQSQFESIGQGNQFQGFRREILGIARDTGVGADEVATVAFQMKGAFDDTTQAVDATKSAIRAAQVTGLDLAEIVDSLTATRISLDLSSFDELTDRVIGLEERFGVLSSQSLKAIGDIAPVAAEAGLGLNEIASILGVIQQRSGRPGSAITDGLARVLPAIGAAAPQLLQLAEGNDALAGSVDGMIRSFAGGETGQVLLTLVKNWDQLDRSTQQYITTLLGGRREAQFLNPLFAGSADIMKELAAGHDDAGKAAERQADQQRTLGYQLGRFREELRQIGESLAQLGLLDAFTMLAATAVTFLRAGGALLRWLAELNEASGGVVGRLLAIAAAFGTIRVAAAALTRIQGLSAITALLSRAGGAASTPLPAGVAGPVLPGGAVSGGMLLTQLRGLLTKDNLVRVGVRVGGGAALGLAGEQLGGRPGALLQIGGAAAAGSAFGPQAAAFAAALTASTIAVESFSKSLAANDEAQRINEETLGKRNFFQLQDLQQSGIFGNANSGLTDNFGGIIGGGGKPTIEGVSAFIFGNKTGAETMAEELQRALLEALQEGANAGILNDTAVADMTADINKDGLKSEAGKRAVAILNNLTGSERKTIDDVLTGKAQVDEAVKNAGATQIQTAETLQTNFQQGTIGWEEYIGGLTTQARLLTQAAGSDPEMQGKALELEAKRNQALVTRATNAASLANQLAQIAGAGPEAQLFSALQALSRGAVQQDPAATQTQVQAAFQAQRQMFDDAVANATSAAEVTRLLQEGVELNPRARQQLEDIIDQQNLGIEVPDRIRGTAAQIKAAAQTRLNEELARRGADRGANRDVVQQARDAQADAQLQLSAATNDTEKFTAVQAVNAAEKALADATLARSISVLETAAAQSEDPLVKAQYQTAIANARRAAAQTPEDRQAADRDLVEAQRAERDQRREIADARRTVAEANAQENAFTLAELGVDAAKDAQARSRTQGVAAQLNAQAERIRADRSLRDALRAIGTAQIDLAIAMAEAAGDQGEVARLGVQQARNRLDALTRESSNPKTDVDVIQARADLVNAEAQQRDQARTSRIDDLEYLFEFDKITAQQLIAGLKAELEQIPETNKDARREIERRIKALRDEMGGDLNFNLPSEIKLPALYEARRLNQAGSMDAYQAGRIAALTGAGVTGALAPVTDNRVISIVLNANNAIDGAAAIDEIVQVITAPPRVGSTRSYP